MPLHRYNVRARRIKLFTRTKQSPSSNTFINNENNTTNNDINDNTISSINSDLSSSIVKSGNMLHSKSTYFYHGGNSSRKKLSHSLSSRLTYVVPSVCGLAFLFGGIIAISPTINQVSATDNDSIMTTAAGDPNISLTVNGNTEMKKNVTTPGEVSYVDNTFSVSVSNSWYAVMVRAANGYTSDLINQQNTNAKVTGVGINVPEANFKENTWGYALTTTTNTANNALTYNTIPESNDFTPAYSATATGTQNQNFKIAFAAKFGNDAPNGNYQTKVYLSAVSNPTQVAIYNEFKVSTMQGMGAQKDYCSNMPENTTGRLMDSRDGKLYWVTKLRDGNCWMVQNLDLDISKDHPLTPDSSDVKSTWPSDSDTVGTFVASMTGWSSQQTAIQFFDPGEYIYTTPSMQNRCDIGGSKTSLGDCSDKGWQYILGWTPFTGVSSAVLDKSTKKYDAHYLIGNYYSWNAATAGTGNSITNDFAASSICPNGWSLPTSGHGNVDGSFEYLLRRYNWAGDASVDASTIGPNGIYASPLFLLYGGYISSIGLTETGYGGYYQSSRAYATNTTHMFILDLFSSVVNPNSNQNRLSGLSVRCLVKTDK